MAGVTGPDAGGRGGGLGGGLGGEGGIAVGGGVGGIAVNLVELAAVADLLDAASGEVAGASPAIRAALARVGVQAALAPAAADRAREALTWAGSSLDRLRTALADCAADVRTAREAYAEAEGLTAVEVRALTTALSGFLGVPGFALPGVATVERALRPLGWLLAALPGTRAAAVVAPAGDPVQGDAPRGVADLMAGISDLYPSSGGQDGSLAVQRIESAGGAVSWTVLIPGTESLAVGGANPMDDATNVQAYTGAPTAVGAAVVLALAMAGARSSEPVLLAGHSQGGIVAMRLASDPVVRRQYRVTSVVTAGSPVGHVPTPDGVSVLHLEHTTDVVTTLDGAANPDEADRVTVRGTAEGGFGAVHDARAYARTADAVDASDHASVAEWRERAAAVLGGPGATATTTVFTVRRP